MATDKRTVEFLAEQTAGAGNIRTRAMFGEYALYCDDKVVALICDDQLYVKITSASRPYLDESYDYPAYPGAKPSIRVPEDYWDDAAWMARLIRETADSLPAKKA
ncbi:MAG TPA: TfoX/Sxy family protein [Candidatus Saccharimonadia bacterium]|nr:TfoX/Sxy family protein [Candidatus Saccharimonadia bacterium]